MRVKEQYYKIKIRDRIKLNKQNSVNTLNTTQQHTRKSKSMSYRRKNNAELINLLHAYKKIMKELFHCDASKDLLALIDESIAVKKKEQFTAMFNTLHISDMIKLKELILNLDVLDRETKDNNDSQDYNDDNETIRKRRKSRKDD